MNQIDTIVDKEALAIKILLMAEKVGHAPMRRDYLRYHQDLLNDLKLVRAKLIFGRMKQERDSERDFVKAHGQQRMHRAHNFPSGPGDRRITQKAMESIKDDIDRIKFWLKTEPNLQGKEGPELINAAVEFFHQYRQK